MKPVVAGLFDHPEDAAHAINTLEDQGIDSERINLITHHTVDRERLNVPRNHQAIKGAIVGASTGGLLTSLVAGLTAAGTIASGGAGLLVAGPIVATLTVGSAGAFAGGVIGSAIGASTPEHDIEYYEKAIERGGVLILVTHKHHDIIDIEQLLKNANAHDVAAA